MEIMNNRKRRKLIRNTICATTCTLLLIATVLVINALTLALKNHNTQETGSASATAEKQTETESETLLAETEQSTEKTSVLTVCIDAGHGGKDIGSDSNGRIEKDDNLKLALAIKEYLLEHNIDVVMTRDDDIFWKLSKRCRIANEANADYMVSLHRNKGEGYGVEAWIANNPTEETSSLAQNIMTALESAGISRNRGVKTGSPYESGGDYILTRDTNMPCCIIELGFLNVEEDNQLFDDNLSAYAKGIGDAIIQTAQTYQPDKLEQIFVSDKSDTVDDTEALEDTTEDAPASTSHTITNTPIENVESLDNTIINFGQGSNVDEQNRPVGSVVYQEQYGKYNAHFISEGDKVIYLTFDEGYEYGYTPAILDTLKEKDVKAVFFVTKPYVEEDPELVQRMIDEGHAVGNHSVTHPASGIPSLPIDQQKYEIEENHRYVKELFDYEMHLFRYPAGKFSEQALAVMNNSNYKSVFWSFAYVDYDVNNQPDQTESLQKCLSKLHSGAIYLLHAESATNAAILGDFIDQARAQGYTFELFD